jgi:hypothetical protein
VVPHIPTTVNGLYAAIYEAFGDYTPVWACPEEDCPNEFDSPFLLTDFKRKYKGYFTIYR